MAVQKKMANMAAFEAESLCNNDGKMVKQCSSEAVEEVLKCEDKSNEQSIMGRDHQKSQGAASDSDAIQCESDSTASACVVAKRTLGRISDVKLDKRNKNRPRSLLSSSAVAVVQHTNKGLRDQTRPASESLADQFSRMHINRSQSYWFV
jgi:hypothetical protein